MLKCEHFEVCDGGCDIDDPMECGYYTPKIDRDALLDLAEDLEIFAETEYCAQTIDDAVCDRLNRFADSIREALKEGR